jgi:flagellar motility protein MotE (MotC chaperone)
VADNQVTDLEDDEEKKGGGLIGVVIALVIIVIWLLIFALLIRMDVGGFGSNVMRPLLENVPVLNAILPPVTDDEVAAETGYKYRTLYEAIERIRELENQLAVYQDAASANEETIAELTAEVERLRVFEENQLAYEENKKRFDEEVVFTANAPDIDTYSEWYELMYPENAAEIYERVVERLQYSSEVKDWASTFSKMEADAAASILEEMTGDLDLVSEILLSMSASKRAEILAEMDPVFAAKLTNVTYPQQ